MNSIYVDIGRRIRELRISSKLTQNELSNKAHISLSFLGHIERGSRKMSVDTLLNLAQALECSINYLTDTGAYGKECLPDMLERAADRLRDLEQLAKQLEDSQDADI